MNRNYYIYTYIVLNNSWYKVENKEKINMSSTAQRKV